MNKDSGSENFSVSALGQQIKPLKKVSFTLPFIDSQTPEKRRGVLKRIQVKNPKWASFSHEAGYEEDYSDLKSLQKCKSLQLVSLALQGRQVGATVGHFQGEIKYIEKVSRYLRKLDFGAGAMSRRRFIDLKKWTMKRKHINDLSLVPYWFPVDDEYNVEDWHNSGQRSAGVVRLIHLLHAQIRKLGLFGFITEDLKENFDFKRMEKLQHLTLKAAFRPESCDGDPQEFGDIHLEFIKKALKSRTLNILTLYCECAVTPIEFWESLKELIVPSAKTSLVVDARIDYIYSFGKTNKHFKRIFADLPSNIKVNYTIHDTSYFLSLPSGFEVIGEEDKEEYIDDSEEGEEENDDEEGQGDEVENN